MKLIATLRISFISVTNLKKNAVHRKIYVNHRENNFHKWRINDSNSLVVNSILHSHVIQKNIFKLSRSLTLLWCFKVGLRNHSKYSCYNKNINHTLPNVILWKSRSNPELSANEYIVRWCLCSLTASITFSSFLFLTIKDYSNINLHLTVYFRGVELLFC